jgi:hypothetical protein
VPWAWSIASDARQLLTETGSVRRASRFPCDTSLITVIGMSQAGGRGSKRSSSATVVRAAVAGLAALASVILSTGVANADEPATTVPPDVEIEVAVEVAVGLPPVPTEAVSDADQPDAGQPDVAVGLPPVPQHTVPDATPAGVALSLW